MTLVRGFHRPFKPGEIRPSTLALKITRYLSLPTSKNQIRGCVCACRRFILIIRCQGSGLTLQTRPIIQRVVGDTSASCPGDSKRAADCSKQAFASAHRHITCTGCLNRLSVRWYHCLRRTQFACQAVRKKRKNMCLLPRRVCILTALNLRGG